MTEQEVIEQARRLYAERFGRAKTDDALLVGTVLMLGRILNEHIAAKSAPTLQEKIEASVRLMKALEEAYEFAAENVERFTEIAGEWCPCTHCVLARADGRPSGHGDSFAA